MKLSKLRIQNYKSFADSGQLELGPVNVIIGRNNSGKSALIHAIHLVQRGADYGISDIRIGQDAAFIASELTDASPSIVKIVGAIEQGTAVLVETRIYEGGGTNFVTSMAGRTINSAFIPNSEPDNFIYTYLSKRKVTDFDQYVNREKTLAVRNNLEYIVSKVDRLANPDHPNAQEYAELCKSILGFRVSSIASPLGHQAGIPVSRTSYIPIEAMGEGVSSLLGLITDLCVAEGNLFLIEELENDIHPEGLKTMLQVIAEKSKTNQFIVSTHSNIVMKYLGSTDEAKIFNVELSYQPGTVPVSTVKEVESNPVARMQILQQLGYELYDFDLWEGWLILEESSAEVIIRDYLIPWFTPKLSRIRTLGAGGISKTGTAFDDFHRLFLFTHLQSRYYGRAWVVVDGDEPGRTTVEKLRKDYNSWPSHHFRTWKQEDFERYYPARFAATAEAALSQRGQDKRSAKKALLDNVKQFCDEHRDEAKQEFTQSASEIISFLKELEEYLFSPDPS